MTNHLQHMEVAPHAPLNLEMQREVLIAEADRMIPDSVKILLREVARYAPPYPVADTSVTVSVEGSCYACPK